jgi:hypothetical protein
MWSGKNSLVPCGGIIAPPEKGWFVALRIAAVVNCLAMPPTVIARKVSKLARINRDIFRRIYAALDCQVRDLLPDLRKNAPSITNILVRLGGDEFRIVPAKQGR